MGDHKYRPAFHQPIHAVLHDFFRAGINAGGRLIQNQHRRISHRHSRNRQKLTLSLGYSHPVEMEDPEGVEAVVEGQNVIIIKGIDKEKVGQYAAEIRDKRRPEPYKGKGIKYADETIRRKVGKTGKK